MNLIDIQVPTPDLIEFTTNDKGLKVVAENYNEIEGKVLFRDTGSLIKWINNNYNVKINYNHNVKKVSLNNNEYWLPLIYLASDITLPIYLSMVANYLYEQLKGSLEGEKEKSIVHLSIEYKDGDKYKKLNYDGPVEGLEKFQKINLNEIMK